MDLAPITHSYRLRCAPEQAFKVYVERIADWWDPAYTRDAATYGGVVIEPQLGGRVYARVKGGADDEWGNVTAWKPGRKLGYTTVLGQESDYASEITVRFTGEGTGTHVIFEHGGWNEANGGDRKKFKEWTKILDRYRDLADSGGKK